MQSTHHQPYYYHTTMENLEGLNTIMDEFHIKKNTAVIFGISGLLNSGQLYVNVPQPPTHLESGYLPDIIYDQDENDNFCSIFSELLERTQITQVFHVQDSTFEKLHSENGILSSDFDYDPQVPILTSEMW